MGIGAATGAGLALLWLGISGPPAAKVPVAFPHPLITEVLYAVPRGEGDANGDGSSHSSGDEFIELVNPHDRSINLGGYVLSDRNAGGRGEFRFVFPKLKVPPGGVVVVFNGNGQTFSGPVGTSKRAPSGTNEAFHGAAVFTAQVKSRSVALANAGDWVLLSDPKGRPIQCVWWGTMDRALPKGVRLMEQAPTTSSGSVQRASVAGAFKAHTDLDGRRFSPGQFPIP